MPWRKKATRSKPNKDIDRQDRIHPGSPSLKLDEGGVFSGDEYLFVSGKLPDHVCGEPMLEDL